MDGNKDFQVSAADLRTLEEVGAELSALKARRDVVRGLIESKSARHWRTVDVVVSTILMGGSLIGAAITPWTLLATPVGFIRWMRTIEKDSAHENAQARLRSELVKLERDVTGTEAKYAALRQRLAGLAGLEK
jgi:hypothetical protein